MTEPSIELDERTAKRVRAVLLAREDPNAVLQAAGYTPAEFRVLLQALPRELARDAQKAILAPLARTAKNRKTNGRTAKTSSKREEQLKLAIRILRQARTPIPANAIQLALRRAGFSALESTSLARILRKRLSAHARPKKSGPGELLMDSSS